MIIISAWCIRMSGCIPRAFASYLIFSSCLLYASASSRVIPISFLFLILLFLLGFESLGVSSRSLATSEIGSLTHRG